MAKGAGCRPGRRTLRVPSWVIIAEIRTGDVSRRGSSASSND